LKSSNLLLPQPAVTFLLHMLRRGAWSLCRQVHTNVNQNAFSDKVALVTGASRGIGLAIAESFAQRGAKVILVSQQPERAKAVEAGFVSRFGTGHQSIALDISNRSLVAEAFKVKIRKCTAKLDNSSNFQSIIESAQRCFN
jgi:hypothetical protein